MKNTKNANNEYPLGSIINICTKSIEKCCPNLEPFSQLQFQAHSMEAITLSVEEVHPRR